ncbi:MAG: 16S rRNA (uracil1498-N3)-methyltransferase [Planctomycetota bacterium]|jgi:16S rRNA (uracil1498-N3)-methyltransferase
MDEVLGSASWVNSHVSLTPMTPKESRGLKKDALGLGPGAEFGLGPGRHVPSFFLEEPPCLPSLDADGGEGGPAQVQLAAGEAEHGLRVLRLSVGDAAYGLDGSGSRWPLLVDEVRPRHLGLVVNGPREEQALNGEPGAPLPWIEVSVAWPRKQRGEEMLGRLTQLGVAGITPLRAQFGNGAPLSKEPPARWDRIVKEHTKQCGRLWLPILRPPVSVLEFSGRIGDAAVALLDPSGPMGLDTWARSLPLGPSLLGTKSRPIHVLVGPEGGFSSPEHDALLEAGASRVRLSPHVLRIETAAEAALAVLGAILGSAWI